MIPNNPFDEGPAPPQYIIQNGLQDVVPDAEFGWGERYEFGLRDDGHEWQISVLDGPEVNNTPNLRQRSTDFWIRQYPHQLFNSYWVSSWLPRLF